MSYFSRLTDIVTCNLSKILADAGDPTAALEEVIDEMQAGVTSAQRSVRTAAANEGRIRTEIEELTNQLTYWQDIARQDLKGGREDKARLALMRKSEVEDLIAGIQQQHASADATLSHLTTTLHALEARLADAARRRASVPGEGSDSSGSSADVAQTADLERLPELYEQRDQHIEDELAALKRELES